VAVAGDQQWTVTVMERAKDVYSVIYICAFSLGRDCLLQSPLLLVPLLVLSSELNWRSVPGCRQWEGVVLQPTKRFRMCDGKNLLTEKS
jgi:hypothetical protein